VRVAGHVLSPLPVHCELRAHIFNGGSVKQRMAAGSLAHARCRFAARLHLPRGFTRHEDYECIMGGLDKWVELECVCTCVCVCV